MIPRTTASEGERSARSRATRAAGGVLALLLLALAVGCGGSGGIESGHAKSGEQVDASGPVQGKLTISQWSRDAR
jgi:hypothetical protein